jgi:uncharacterized RDD family membrane protein YckC
MWYYVENGQQRGPVQESDLDALRQEGKITSETLVWREGMDNWQPLSQVQPAAAGVATAAPAPAGSGATVACSQCGMVLPVSEVIRYGNASVCANCKPLFVQKLREGASVTTGQMDFASFGIRLAAYLIDTIILSIFAMIIGGVFGAMMFAGANRAGANGLGLSFFLVQGTVLIVQAAYYTYFVGKSGQTPGKKLCKIKVVNADGTPVGYAKALGRFFAYLLSSFTCLIGFLMAAWDDQRRALHDRVCSTRVVKQ